MLIVVTFAEHGGKTTVNVNSLPLDASDDEIKTFNAGRGSMTQGWGGTRQQLEAYLADAQKSS